MGGFVKWGVSHWGGGGDLVVGGAARSTGLSTCSTCSARSARSAGSGQAGSGQAGSGQAEVRLIRGIF